jgi:hypothetical protein
MPKATDITIKRRPPSPLIERGGLALVEFHLARRGIEAMRTQQHSDRGDIWAQAPIGMISIEVKTTANGTGWFVNRRQHSSEVYCLVHLDTARVWVLTAEEMDGLLERATDIHAGKIASVMAKDLPADSLEAWNKIGGVKMFGVGRFPHPNRHRSDRVVTHTLRDGTVKTYRYARHGRKAADIS